MAFAAAENESTGITSSAYSLKGSHIRKTVVLFASYPFVMPNLSAEPQQNIVQKIKHAGKVCHQWIRMGATKRIQQKDDISLDESKYRIREIAAELERVIQSRMSMSRKIKNKATKEEQEEQEYYILQWAKDVENIQTKQTDREELLNKEMKVVTATKILSDWSCSLKEMKQNSVCPNGEYEETLRDLKRQWKQGESSILPVIDWMVWTVLQSESSKDLVPRLWVKSKQRSRNTVGLRIPNPVWNWITKSKAVVILDPKTANPDLLVTEGKYLRAKKYTGHDHWEGFQRKPTTYDGWTCVQAKEGYNTGRHYWEVDVRKKSEWRVGVVKKSAPRNGYVTMNTKTGYWNVRLQLRTLMALTEPVTKLNLPTPSKIGVYLDIEEGHVSFYDAEKRRHIYTFNTDFSETGNIYPMFGTVETDRALVISS